MISRRIIVAVVVAAFLSLPAPTRAEGPMEVRQLIDSEAPALDIFELAALLHSISIERRNAAQETRYAFQTVSMNQQQQAAYEIRQAAQPNLIAATVAGGVQIAAGGVSVASIGHGGGSAMSYLATEAGGQMAIYAGNSDGVGLIADMNTNAPGGGGQFTAFGPYAAGPFATAFAASAADGSFGVYSGADDQSLATEACDELIATLLELEAMQVAEADFIQTVEENIQNFTAFVAMLTNNEEALIQSDRQIAAFAGADPILSLVADQSTAVPSASGTFTDFANPRLDPDGNVYFIGTGSAGSKGIYKCTDGTLTKIVDNNDGPDGASFYTNFFTLSVDEDRYAFHGTVFFKSGDSDEGIYVDMADGNGLCPVIEVGDSLGDSTVTALTFGREGMSGKWLAFIADLADGTQAAYVARPECRADFDLDGSVGFSDLTVLLAAWGPCPACIEDLGGNASVGFADLTILLSEWGPCP